MDQRNSSGAGLWQHYEWDTKVASVVSSSFSEELSKPYVPAVASTQTKVPASGKSWSAALQSLPTLKVTDPRLLCGYSWFLPELLGNKILPLVQIMRLHTARAVTPNMVMHCGWICFILGAAPWTIQYGGFPCAMKLLRADEDTGVHDLFV